jgi:uncharacterized metal-binding protein YceD (DUF177 family)
MRTACVVNAEVLRERSACLRDVRVPLQIDLFVPDAAAQPLDEYVGDPATLASKLMATPASLAAV